MHIDHLLEKQINKEDINNANFMLSDDALANMHGIKYVCMQGSADRAKQFAIRVANCFYADKNIPFLPVNLIENSSYVAYRVGDMLSVSHGVGGNSILTLLHSITKVMYYAGNFAVEYIRIGTAGGVGVDAGNVVLTNTTYMPNLVPGYKVSILDHEFNYMNTQMNQDLNKRILAAQPQDLPFKILVGNSIAADDFYLGQSRFDGAIKPRYDTKMRDEYFAKIKQLNILNFEMESTALASFCNLAKIPATMLTAILLNRLAGDQVTASHDMLLIYQERAQDVAINYLKHKSALNA